MSIKCDQVGGTCIRHAGKSPAIRHQASRKGLFVGGVQQCFCHLVKSYVDKLRSKLIELDIEKYKSQEISA
jgi:hypothetical protein